MSTQTIFGQVSIANSLRRGIHIFARAVLTSPQGRMDQAAAKVLTKPFEESDYVKEQRAKAIERLGENWVLHSNYKPNPKHSNSMAIWWPHRTLKFQS